MKAELCNELALALQDYDFLKSYISGAKPFIDYPYPEKTRDEKIIGELNFFEKALWSAARDGEIASANEAYELLQYFVNLRLKRDKNAKLNIRKGFKIIETKK